MCSPPALESQATSSQGSLVASLSEEDPRKSQCSSALKFFKMWIIHCWNCRDFLSLHKEWETAMMQYSVNQNMLKSFSYVFFFAPFSPHGEQKVNAGLNLKFNKKNEEVPGYTKRTEKEWLYSAAVEELLAEYLERCVCVFVFVLLPCITLQVF